MKLSISPKYRKYPLLFLMIVLLTQCITIEGVEQPGTAIAGEELTITLHAKIEPAGNENNTRLVVGFLAPRKWNAGTNTTMTYTSNRGNGTMSRIPAGAKATGLSLDWEDAIQEIAGIGGNLIEDMEWVAFWSDQTYNVANGSPDILIDVSIKTVPGPQNLIAQLGYFVTSSLIELNDPANYDIVFTDCFEVTGGEGALINFCSPQLAFVDPLLSMDNDLITINFDGAVVPTPLTGAGEVFLCATGYMQDGTPVEICGRDENSKMKSVTEDLWYIDLWPRKYFGLNGDQTLERMEYYFTNQAGDIQVVDQDSGLPFVYPFTCE